MTSDESTRTDGIPPDAPFRFACACGYRTERARAATVEWLHFNEHASLFTVECPDCNIARPTKVLKGTFSGQHLVCVVAGQFIDDPEKRPTGHACYTDSNNATFDGVPSPVEMASGAFLIRCSACDGLLSENDYHADHRAPEVGWEYYECPDCGARTRADNAEVNAR